MSYDKQFPCGNCLAGTYAYGAVRGGIELFGDCPDQISALRVAPRCKHRPRQICMGARDFIVSSSFPISGEIRKEFAVVSPATRGTP